MKHDWRYIQTDETSWKYPLDKISIHTYVALWNAISCRWYYTISRKSQTESTFEQLRAIKAITVKKCSLNFMITLNEGKWSQKSFNSACLCRCVFVCALHFWNSYSYSWYQLLYYFYSHAVAPHSNSIKSQQYRFRSFEKNIFPQ